MAISVNTKDHKAVVVTSGGEGNNKYMLSFGFPHIYSAVAFVERQIVDKTEDKTLNMLVEAFGDGVEIDESTYQVLDIKSYLDVYGEDEEDEDNEW